ncbi:MAG: Stk1 family PASTA domain-containing Ser/Thr kinase [Propionibacteriaceae bacterium]|jgi:serine/threonine-protein kinase|nr:Stk1 family PASTA domain-containing Ser/Thr kinase [Propionibacteriaceae bacterium]
MTDSLIGGRYVLGPLLGRGGMAEVRRAHDVRLDRDVAIKRLKPDLAGDPIFLERFRREAHAAAGLNHPNIVSVFDTGESIDPADGQAIPYIVMELVVGHTLREILHDGRKIQPTKALQITASILDALDYSHRHGIIHRDIKPANVMLTDTGQVKVMDFGIARAVSDTAASMTQTASVIGTPQYLSPEQIRGDAIDRRSDIYATGCLLYELLTGNPPFQGDSPVSLAYQHVRATPVPPSQVDPLISTEMDAVVLKALAKNPDDRYQTAHEMEEDIQRLLHGQHVLAVAPPALIDDDATSVMTPTGDRTQVLTTGVAPVPGRPARAAEPLAEEAEDDRSRLGKIIGIVLGIILAIALITTGLVLWFNRDQQPGDGASTPTMFAVPAVTTMQQENAEKILTTAGFKTKVTQYHGADDETVGTVTEQDPKHGELVRLGTTITLQVNIGPEERQVPDVKDRSTADASALLNEAGFKNLQVADASLDESAGKTAGTVIRTEPVAGATIKETDPITIYVATGNVKMPDLSGMGLDQAQSTLAQAGFTNVVLKSIEVSDANHVGSYTVDHPAGEAVTFSTQITLTVADLMPNVANLTYGSTRNNLAAWGLNPIDAGDQQTKCSGDTQKISDQDPAFNSQVTVGQDVTLFCDNPDPTSTTSASSSSSATTGATGTGQ